MGDRIGLQGIYFIIYTALWLVFTKAADMPPDMAHHFIVVILLTGIMADLSVKKSPP